MIQRNYRQVGKLYIHYAVDTSGVTKEVAAVVTGTSQSPFVYDDFVQIPGVWVHASDFGPAAQSLLQWMEKNKMGSLYNEVAMFFTYPQ